MPNLGEVRVEGVTGQGDGLALTMQVAEVKKPLASVRKMCKAGNRVVFEDGDDDSYGGYVENKASGRRVPITKLDGTYQVHMWTRVAANNGESTGEDVAAFEGDEEEPVIEGANSAPSSGFTRHA
jgi:hypothetical protein